MDETYHPTRPRGVSRVKVERARELRREMTPEERTLWRELRLLRDQGCVFRRQQVIAGFIADFYCYPAQLVVEVDGGAHAMQGEYDSARDDVLAAHGLTVLRVSNEDVRERLSEVVRRITVACAARNGR
jgi:very-short-patch-repair endonuclease